ncbi:MAG: chemotaxis protein [Azospirillum sp.]|nr:chemotaxis protein [Azospirillum sp.]
MFGVFAGSGPSREATSSSSRPLPSGYVVSGGNSKPQADDGELFALLDRGAFLDLLARADLPEALRHLAAKLEERSFDGLDSLVTMSMLINESVIAAATMARQTNKASDNAQTIAAAAEELVYSTRQIAEHGARVAHEAEAARDGTERIRSGAQHANAGMDRISHSVERTMAKVQELAAASEQIGRIVQQIEAIAKQTNLLALNATIEAARAGDAGRGFGVVASEVKTLSRQTAQATTDIRKQIGHLREEISVIVGAMKDSAEAVDKGHGLIQAVVDDAEAIAGRIADVSRGMAEVSRILDEQGSATGEVSHGIADVAELLKVDGVEITHVLDCMDGVETAVAKRLEAVAHQQISGSTVSRAKADHVIWKKRLAAMMLGRVRLDPKELADHRQCRLGKWYEGLVDPVLRGHPAYRAILEPHRLVHDHGIAAARCYNAGKLDDALAHIAQVETASVDVIRLLDELTAASRPTTRAA